jgi:hypothetical protein
MGDQTFSMEPIHRIPIKALPNDAAMIKVEIEQSQNRIINAFLIKFRRCLANGWSRMPSRPMPERTITWSTCCFATPTAAMPERIVSAGETFGVIIETARLRLRPLRDEDLADMVMLIDNWEVACWL